MPVTRGMDRPGDQLLAGPAFARNQHGLWRGGDLQNATAQRLHHRAGSDHDGLIRAVGPGLVDEQSPVTDRLRDETLQRIDVERLLDVVERAMPHGLDRRGNRRMGRHHDDLHAQSALLQLDDEFDAAHAGHLEVGDDAVEAFGLKFLEGFGRARATGNLMARLTQHIGHRLAGLAVIVHDQDTPGDGGQVVDTCR